MNEQPKCTITLSGSRGDEWEAVLGGCTFQILSPSAEICSLEGNVPQHEMCVMLDVRALSEKQQAALIDHMARKFGSSRREAELEILSRGVPIRLGADTKIDVPAGYTAPRPALRNGPNVFDFRLLT